MKYSLSVYLSRQEQQKLEHMAAFLGVLFHPGNEDLVGLAVQTITVKKQKDVPAEDRVEHNLRRIFNTFIKNGGQPTPILRLAELHNILESLARALERAVHQSYEIQENTPDGGLPLIMNPAALAKDMADLRKDQAEIVRNFIRTAVKPCAIHGCHLKDVLEMSNKALRQDNPYDIGDDYDHNDPD